MSNTAAGPPEPSWNRSACALAIATLLHGLVLYWVLTMPVVRIVERTPAKVWFAILPRAAKHAAPAPRLASADRPAAAEPAIHNDVPRPHRKPRSPRPPPPPDEQRPALLPAPPVPTGMPAEPSQSQALAAGHGADGGHGFASTGHGGVGTSAGLGDEWLERARHRLNAFRTYPQDAMARKEEGTVRLSIVVAKDGTVLGVEIETSSGSARLDAAAMKMVRDASPLPPLPASYDSDRVTFAIPETYSIGFLERLFN